MERVVLKISDELKGRPLDYVTENIVKCVGFWNREGDKAIQNNISGKWGDKETQEMAKKMQADDFLLEMLLRDCRGFVNSDFAKNSGDKYECGRVRSHVWVHINDNRVLMLYAEKENWVNYDEKHLMNTTSGVIVSRDTNLGYIQPADIKGIDRL